MLRLRTEAWPRLRISLAGLATLAATIIVAAPAPAAYRPPYSAIVVDVKAGTVLHATVPDAERHPASLTKIMTLYLLFERLEAGTISLDTKLSVSEHAASQAPSKLGLKPGQTIEVEDAIKALVTKSANDVAVVVAEAIGGSETAFAEMMNDKARALNMRRTVYKNASGLPDDDQVTTARDQSILARAIQERFPKYYKYFATRSFTYHGKTMGNHNKLLGRVDGVDGIKTGYTRASGFNLVTSVRRGDRQIVAVVMGGRTASKRDAQMRELIADNIHLASTKRTAPSVLARVLPTTAVPLPPRAPEPIRPVLVRTFTVKPGEVQANGIVPLQLVPVASPDDDAENSPRLAFASEDTKPVPVSALPPAPAAAAPATTAASPTSPSNKTAKDTAKDDADVATASTTAPKDPPKPRTGWIIQVGAFTAETEAQQRLSEVKDKVPTLLKEADPFTETVVKDKTTYYRARFAGLDKNNALAACQHLKRNDVACFALKN